MSARGHLTEHGLSHHEAWWSGHTADQAERYARRSVAESGGTDFRVERTREDPRRPGCVQVLARWTETGPEAAGRRGLLG